MACGYVAMWLCGQFGTISNNFKVSKLQSFKISNCQHVRIAKLQSSRISNISNFTSFTEIPICKLAFEIILKVSQCQGFKVQNPKLHIANYALLLGHTFPNNLKLRDSQKHKDNMFKDDFIFVLVFLEVLLHKIREPTS